jgi:hypothetical protein
MRMIKKRKQFSRKYLKTQRLIIKASREKDSKGILNMNTGKTLELRKISLKLIEFYQYRF